MTNLIYSSGNTTNFVRCWIRKLIIYGVLFYFFFIILLLYLFIFRNDYIKASKEKRRYMLKHTYADCDYAVRLYWIRTWISFCRHYQILQALNVNFNTLKSVRTSLARSRPPKESVLLNWSRNFWVQRQNQRSNPKLMLIDLHVAVDPGACVFVFLPCDISAQVVKNL